jgi:hypothetical protein
MSSALPSLSLLPGERPEFTFCEPVWVTGPSPWCIRKPSPVGPKFGGGVDTPSLCGRVPVGQGWDLEVRITKHHLGNGTCKKCLELYLAQGRA